MKQKNIDHIIPGEQFTFGGKKFTLLERFRDGVKVVSSEIAFTEKFDGSDRDDRNNFANSSLLRRLKGEFVDNLVAAGAAHSDMRPFDTGLLAQDGMRDYGPASSMVSLLTLDEYRKYRYLLPEVIGPWWLATPYSCDDDLPYACMVDTSGAASIDSVYYSYGVRPALYLEPGLFVSVDDDQEKGLDGYTELELLAELQRRVQG